jgi:hypothetical protein
LSAVLPSYTSPDEITSSRLFKKASPVLKIARKGTVARKQVSFFFLLPKKLTVSRRSERSKEEIKSKSREIESVSSANTFGLQGQKTQKNKSIKTGIHNQEIAEDFETRCCECLNSYVQTTKEDDWIRCGSCRSLLHEFCYTYEDKRVDCGSKLLREKNSKMQKMS